MRVQRENARSGAGEAVRDFLGSLWDALEKPVSDALADVRHKVVEEGWFGREITPAELSIDLTGAAQEPLGFKELMAAQAAMVPEPPAVEAPDQAIDI